MSVTKALVSAIKIEKVYPDVLSFVGPHNHCGMILFQRFLGLALLRLLPNELIDSLGSMNSPLSSSPLRPGRGT